MKPILSFDIDGVIADGHYIPAWDRCPEVYASLKPIDGAAEVLGDLAMQYHIYLLSSRKFDNALAVTRNWVAKHICPLECLAGIVVGVPRLLKAMVSKDVLGASLHIDDDPKVVQMAGVRGLWFEGKEWVGYEDCAAHNPKVKGWDELYGWVVRNVPPQRAQLRLDLARGEMVTAI